MKHESIVLPEWLERIDDKVFAVDQSYFEANIRSQLEFTIIHSVSQKSPLGIRNSLISELKPYGIVYGNDAAGRRLKMMRSLIEIFGDKIFDVELRDKWTDEILSPVNGFKKLELPRFKVATEGSLTTDEIWETTSFPEIRAPELRNRTAIIDIEVNSPRFNNMTAYTQLLCVSFRPFDGPEKTFHIDFADNRSDKRLVKEVVEYMAEFEFLIGHYVKGYDLNWIKSRCMYFGWKPPRRVQYYCTYAGAKRSGLLHRKSLGSLIDFFRIAGVEKTQIMPNRWDMINSAKEEDFNKSLADVIYHCAEDTLATKKVYDLVYGYDPKPQWKQCY